MLVMQLVEQGGIAIRQAISEVAASTRATRDRRWESEEAFQRFGEVIGPILEEVGFPGEPKLYPLENFVK